ncbi:MAG: S-layer homology domain-containing protein [Epulopiscium sp.]|nr:S-layer homology domain-containing protein [Candidatus Epulonipiscium sp.]
MYEIGKKRELLWFLCFFVLTLFLFIPRTIFAAGSTEADQAFQEGYRFGKIMGEVKGERAASQKEKLDWRSAFTEDKGNLNKDFGLDQYSLTYKNYFRYGFEKGFQEGYTQAYTQFSTQKKLTDGEMGNQHGEILGMILGTIYGKEDYDKGLTNLWERHLLSEMQIRKRYQLNKDTKQYIESFIKAFINGYKEGYVTAYRDTHFQNHLQPMQQAVEEGQNLGQQVGNFFAHRDWQQLKANDWEASLKEFEKQESIVYRYQLFLESKEYQMGFMAGFRDGFREAYIQAFQERRESYGTENMNYYWVDQAPQKMILEESTVSFQKGQPVTEVKEVAFLEIPQGAFYEKIYLGFGKNPNLFRYRSFPFTPSSDVISINVIHSAPFIVTHQPLILSFPWHGNERVGIYEQVNGEWRYLYSTIQNQQVMTELSYKHYSDGTYVMMVDDSYQEIKDLYGHWAQKELYTFLRRGYIQGDQQRLYYPDAPMTRGDFLALISTIQKWPLSSKVDLSTTFHDYGTFDQYNDIITYAFTQGYVSGYSDGTFRPYQPMTYQEVEWILQKILKKSDFTWDTMEQRLLNKKFIRSKSRWGKQQLIPKSEIIYLFYSLQEENILS